MQSNENERALSEDPLARLLRTPGTILRVAGLLLGTAALFLPAYSRSGFDVSFNIGMAEALPYAAVLPVAAAAALFVTAVPRTVRYLRLADIVVAAIGAVMCLQLIAMHAAGARSAASATATIRPIADPGAGAGLEPGFWLIAASTIAFAAAAVLSLRRRVNA